MNKNERSAASTGADSGPQEPMQGLAEWLRAQMPRYLPDGAVNIQLDRWASEVEALRQRPGALPALSMCPACFAECDPSQRPGAQAASEQYPSDWKRVVLMVSPTGELHSIGGDNDAPAGAESCHPGFERIKKFWVRAAPAGERPAQAEPMTDAQIDALALQWGNGWESRERGDGQGPMRSMTFIDARLRYFARAIIASQSARERPGAQGGYDGVTTHPEFGPGAQAPSTADVYLRVTRPEGYEDVHPELVVADMEIHSAFEVEVVAAPSTGGAETAPTWDESQRVCNLPGVDEAIRNLVDDPTDDNATCLVRAVLTASSAPAQAVETAGVREALAELVSELNQFASVPKALRPALLKARAVLQSPAASPASKEDGSHE